MSKILHYIITEPAVSYEQREKLLCILGHMDSVWSMLHLSLNVSDTLLSHQISSIAGFIRGACLRPLQGRQRKNKMFLFKVSWHIWHTLMSGATMVRQITAKTLFRRYSNCVSVPLLSWVTSLLRGHDLMGLWAGGINCPGSRRVLLWPPCDFINSLPCW